MHDELDNEMIPLNIELSPEDSRRLSEYCLTHGLTRAQALEQLIEERYQVRDTKAS